ncbi:glycosyltransferase [Micromonospora sp. WMMD998]|uniref:glycosyltransferase n=1 Tax=Micromonospora sp. WMMD998 TaxID=3016092 RepID=UPI00249ACAFE|nr:glycosyltransferase [Micromonospora sp. WMMD998]WFE38254.1 glycosyltransferase [Micromonospora sp. WMMD998]
MKICFVGKYPPIEGGVSAQNYWAAAALASRGHEVYVVTNSNEVEERFRQRLDDVDAADYEPQFPATGGAVKVIRPEPMTPRRMAHIPSSNPFVSKLAGLAAATIRENGCELIVAYYFEPYVVAGHLASTFTRTPMMVEHAGSDLDRLMRVPELATVYKDILRSATAVVTKPSLVHRFLGMGVAREALRFGPPYPLPTSAFSPEATPLDPGEIAAASIDEFGSRFDPALPTIGMYGKPGDRKGTFDLIAALAVLAGRGLRFNALFLSGRSQLDRMRADLRAAGLAERTTILDFVPPWQVGRFIRTCTAVCFLERDFPIGIHGPVVPREVLACGVCLVLSGEILEKQSYAHRLTDQGNVLVVTDPKEHDKLAAQLEIVVRDPAGAARIGAAGGALGADFDSFETFADAWESLVDIGSPAQRVPAPRTPADLLAEFTPKLAEMFGPAWPDVVAEFTAAYDIDTASGDFAVTEAFCQHLTRRLDQAAPAAGVSPAYLADALRFQQARLWACQDGPHDRDGHAGIRFSPALLRRMAPRRAGTVRVESFDHNVTDLFCRPTGPVGVRSTQSGERSVVCFVRRPNLDHRELRLNAATCRLLDLCDGNRTVGDLVAALAPAAEADVLRALVDLRREGVVVLEDAAQGTP